MRLIKLICYTTFLLLPLICIKGNARATPFADITYIETYTNEGWWYEYTVTNALESTSDPAYNLWKVDFFFAKKIILSEFDLPDGWGSTEGSGFIFTISMMPGVPPNGNDIAPGESLGGFVFLFTEQVGDLPFTAWFENSDPPFDQFTDSGTTSPIPEPATILLVATGAVGLGLWRRKKRWK